MLRLAETELIYCEQLCGVDYEQDLQHRLEPCSPSIDGDRGKRQVCGEDFIHLAPGVAPGSRLAAAGSARSRWSCHTLPWALVGTDRDRD